MPKKLNQTPIKYTDRDFESIKESLVNYAKRYYPTIYQDFNEASFGSLMLDTVSYVGDILSFYLDYQANESFLSTAAEFDNIIRLGRQLGYKYKGAASAHGNVSLYIKVDSDASGLLPEQGTLPILKKGSTFSTDGGVNFTLVEDVDFADPNNETIVAETDPQSGQATKHAVKAFGQVVSGRETSETFTIGNYERFRKIRLSGRNIVEIISVVDGSGHEYFEVEHLSQNLIYKQVLVKNEKGQILRSMRPTVVARRFVVEREFNKTFLQFGHGSDDKIDTMPDPGTLILDLHGKDYSTDRAFDPSKLLANDKFGVGPTDTLLTVTYRTNASAVTNVPSEAIKNVVRPILEFNLDNEITLPATSIAQARGSLEVANESPITGDTYIPTIDELKVQIKDHFAAQNRAVTKKDYISLAYNMPSKFGSIKKCNVIQDDDALKRNLNIYVVSADSNNSLTQTDSIIKNNLKSWVNQHKMINDTVDIVDAKIVNLGLEFMIIADLGADKSEVLEAAQTNLANHFSYVPEMGSEFFITDVYKVLNSTRGVADTVDVQVTAKTGGPYSSIGYNLYLNMSPDARYILFPEDFIWEIRIPRVDIKGTVK